MNRSFSVHELLKHYSLQLEDIARRCECSVHEVIAALDPQHYTRIPLFTVLRIRAIIEHELRELGWEPNSGELWNEFDG